MIPERPPRVSEWVLRRCARWCGLDELVDDVDSLYVTQVKTTGRRAARRWFRQQARSAVWQAFRHTRQSVGDIVRFRSLTGLSLDLKLAGRMLIRYPGLTIVGGLAMAFAIFVGAGLFEFISQTLPGRNLPIPDGDRVVGIRYWDQAAAAAHQPSAVDVRRWRDGLTTVDHAGAFATADKDVTSVDGGGGRVQIAFMSPQGFELAGTLPALGRTYTATDIEQEAAVVVIGDSAWHAYFGGRTNVIGEKVMVDRRMVTVIGVMPPGFKFPVNHSMWMPLDIDRTTLPLRMFGRLKPGVSQAQAQAELAALDAALPISTNADRNVVPLVQWYREALFDRPIGLLIWTMVQQLNLFAVLFLTLVAANIALLTFARAAARERELVVREALGAGRRRIVLQFLIEALALFGVAMTVGLAAAGPGLAWVERRIGDMGGGISPFWFSPSLSADTILYAILLTLFAALLAGGLPGLRATRQLSAARLQQATVGNGSLRLGGVWSVVVITQVAATVVFTAGAALMWRQAMRSGSIDAAFDATRYVTMWVDSEGVDTFVDTLVQQPGVAGVALADRLPLLAHGPLDIEIEGAQPAAGPTTISSPHVSPEFFDVFGATMVSGRPLTVADVRPTGGAVVVDDRFVAEVLGQQNAVGRRLRFLGSDGASPGPWFDIVGVVRRLEHGRPGALYLDNQSRPFVYRVLNREQRAGTVIAAVRADSSAAAALPAIRRAIVDTPDARVTGVQTLDQAVAADAAFWRLWAELIVIAGALSIVLAMAGIFAVMSFAVTRRTREIGIRMALGAHSVNIARDVLRSTLTQVAAGTALGFGLIGSVYWLVAGVLPLGDAGLLAAFCLALAAVCLLACVGPLRRALAVQPGRAIGSSV